MYIPKKSGRIDDIWIDPAFRRKCICLEVVKNLVHFFKDDGVSTVALDYIKGNAESELVWDKLGFKPILITAVTSTDKVMINLNSCSTRTVFM